LIVVDQDPTLLLITQSDHAHFSGGLLALWRSHSLPENPRRDDILFAAREHDNGWREADAAARVEPETGRPCHFMMVPEELRQEIWKRGASRFLRRHPYAALLIIRHALEIHRDRRGEDGWGEFFGGMEELQVELTEELAVDEELIAADYRFVDLADTVSLTACNRWPDPFEHRRLDIGGHFEGDTVVLEPFPLAGATTFRVPCRRIPNRPYRGDADLVGEMAAARWDELRVRVAPAPTPRDSGG
jgi:hypothetical protein